MLHEMMDIHERELGSLILFFLDGFRSQSFIELCLLSGDLAGAKQWAKKGYEDCCRAGHVDPSIDLTQLFLSWSQDPTFHMVWPQLPQDTQQRALKQFERDKKNVSEGCTHEQP